MMASSASVASATTQSSQLFSSVFAGFDIEHRLTVFDVGLALSESLDFFSAFRCRLHYLDLFDEELVRNPPTVEDCTDGELQQRFSELLQFPTGTRLDVCLLWDFPCYLDRRMLRAFTAALKPWLHAGTRGHALGLLNAQAPPPFREYSIVRSDQFSFRPRRGVQGDWYAHPQADFARSLHGLAVQRAVLLADGRLEILLGSTVRR